MSSDNDWSSNAFILKSMKRILGRLSRPIKYAIVQIMFSKNVSFLF